MTKTNNKKKIWIFHHYATPPTMNGFTRPYNFAINLKELGYDVVIFAASYLHFADKNLINDNQNYIINKDTEIPFVFIKTPSFSSNGIGRVLNMVAFFKGVLTVTSMFKKNGYYPDLVLASSPHPLALLAGIRVAKRNKVPIINEIRDFWPEVFFTGGKLKENSFIGKLLIKGEHWLYKKSDALIFLKEGDFTYITDKKWDTLQGGEIDLNKVHYINNGVDIENFNQQMISEKINDEDLNSFKFKVIYTGAIRPVNNIGNILDTAKLLLEKKDIQFLIYGEGNQLNFLKKRVIDENITNVKFKGYINKKNIPYLLSKSNVNILNYSQNMYNWTRGNSSNKLFEYMASGKPIISTVKMGYSPIEKYKCGISLVNNTPQEFSEAILKMYTMSDEEYKIMGNNSLKAAKEFDYKLLTKKLYLVMEELINAKDS